MTKACSKPSIEAAGVFLPAQHTDTAPAGSGDNPMGRADPGAPGAAGPELRRGMKPQYGDEDTDSRDDSSALHATGPGQLFIPTSSLSSPQKRLQQGFNPFPWAWEDAQGAQDLTHPAALSCYISPACPTESQPAQLPNPSLQPPAPTAVGF